jgi:hypothetical protein
MQGGTERCKEPGSLAMWTTIPTPNAFFWLSLRETTNPSDLSCLFWAFGPLQPVA